MLNFVTNFGFLFFSNWGTESDPDMQYHNGNTDPRGFGKQNLIH